MHQETVSRMRHRWQHASASQRFTVASLGLLILLFPVLLWAIFSQTRFWSKAAPATPPATAPIVTPTPTPAVVPVPVFSNLSATLTATQATFRFTYPGTSYPFRVHLSTNKDMVYDVYGTFAQGSKSPIIENNPKKWDKYTCGRLLFWAIQTDTGIQSPVQSATVTCTTVTPTSTIRPTIIPPTPTPTPSSFLRVVYPNGGEVLQEGLSYTMRWEASADLDKIDYAFRSPDGKYNYWINSSPLPNTGSAQITIANPAPKQYSQYYLLIKGTKTGTPLLRTDTSDGVFGILPPPPTPTFTPTPTPTPTPIRVPVACLPADLDRNGTVDERDYNWIAVDFFSSRPSNSRTDMNHDGIVDLVDYSLLVQSYGKKTGPCL